MAVSPYSLYCLMNPSSGSDSSMFFDKLLRTIRFDQASNIKKFMSRCWFFVQSQFVTVNSFEESQINPDSDSGKSRNFDRTNNDDQQSLSRLEVEVVMRDLGLEREEVMESINSNEISNLFGDNEPSFEELKQTFELFDLNKDGFIDEEELQRVLRILGLTEGKDLHNCRQMINNFDKNGDGKIDFDDFIEVLDKSFC